MSFTAVNSGYPKLPQAAEGLVIKRGHPSSHSLTLSLHCKCPHSWATLLSMSQGWGKQQGTDEIRVQSKSPAASEFDFHLTPDLHQAIYQLGLIHPEGN